MESSSLDVLLEALSNRADCDVLPPVGQPELPADFALPDEVRCFYERCGGLWIGDPGGVRWRVVGPGELVPAAERLLPPETVAWLRDNEPQDLAATTFVFADNGGMSTDEHVLIDLAPSRRGRFYSAFWDTFGAPGNMPLIARSVTGALQWIATASKGGAEEALRLHPALGDAFDQA